MDTGQHGGMKTTLHVLVVALALVSGVGELLKLQAWRLRDRLARS
jgi:hypothetical protein